MMILVLLGIFGIVTAALWSQGLWSCAVTLINLILAMLIAANFYEPVCAELMGAQGGGAGGLGLAAHVIGLLEKLLGPFFKSITYLLDFLVLWVLFAVAFGVLRGITDAISRRKVKFIMPVEMAGRSLLAAWCGWLVICFVAFSLHMAPLNSVSPLGAWTSPQAPTFMFTSPDRLWLAFMHTRSKGALAGEAVFDPDAQFALKYRDRRDKYANKVPGMRVQ